MKEKDAAYLYYVYVPVCTYVVRKCGKIFRVILRSLIRHGLKVDKDKKLFTCIAIISIGLVVEIII